MKGVVITGLGTACPPLRDMKICALNNISPGNLGELRLQHFQWIFLPHFLRLNILSSPMSTNLDLFVELMFTNFWRVALQVGSCKDNGRTELSI